MTGISSEFREDRAQLDVGLPTGCQRPKWGCGWLSTSCASRRGTMASGDLSDLTDLLVGYDNALHRGGVKPALNSLLKDGQAQSQEIIRQLPLGTKRCQLREALAFKHPDLAPLFGTTVGLGLMFAESRILLAALEIG
jgi:hypothetical protein